MKAKTLKYVIRDSDITFRYWARCLCVSETTLRRRLSNPDAELYVYNKYFGKKVKMRMCHVSKILNKLYENWSHHMFDINKLA